LITIFIVDDNDVNLITAEKALGDFYNVYTLPSAEAMFELLEGITPDLILLDIKMPEMDGFEAIKILKANPKYISIPVIFLTGKKDDEARTTGLELGAVDFVTKPFDEGELFRIIMLCTQ